MGDAFDIDDSEVRALTAELTNSTRNVERDVRAVVSKGALNIKTQLASEMAASDAFKGTARAMSYDMSGNAFYSEAAIGPDKARGGALATIAYFGGSNGGGGTVPDPRGALERETPNFERALGDILGELL